MDSEMLHVPADVPDARIVDLDVYALPGADADFLAAWKAVQDAAPSSLIWTPRNGGHWIATRGPEIAAAYTDHVSFSSRAVLVPRDWAEPFQVKPTTLDPPLHTPYRRLISVALTPAIVERARPLILKAAEVAIVNVAPRGRCEFIRDVAATIPLAVFMQMADLPLADIDRLPQYNEPLIDEDGAETNADIMTRFADYLRPHCAARLARPREDFLSRIICGEVDGKPLSEHDAVDMATTMMTGGVDTVISTLGLLVSHLARDPQLRARLVTEPDLIPIAVREMVRRYPIMTKARLVTRQIVLDGVRLKPGDMVVLPPLHGLDERIFDDPLTVDIDRPAQPNLSFGVGVHRCPGMLLALAQIETVLAVWLVQIPDFEIDPACPPRMQGGVLGAVQQLGLVWAPDGATPA